MNHIQDFLTKTLTSRKFWAALAAAISFAAAGDWQSFAYVWMTYAGIQGAVDASERVGSAKETLKIGNGGPPTKQWAAGLSKMVDAAAEMVAATKPEGSPAEE